MPTLKDKAINFKSRDITDLDKISVDIEIKTGEFEKNGKKVPYDYFEVDGWKYSIKADVLKQIQLIVTQNPGIKFIKVKRTPSGVIYVEPVHEVTKV